MKKLHFKTVALALICMLFFFNQSFANNEASKSKVCLKFNGLILKSPKEERGLYVLELYKDKSLIETKVTSINKAFEFHLAKNSNYTLRISKEGFIPVLIKVDTKLMESNSNLYEFRFQTELHPNTVVSTVDKNKLEEPLGIVKYDSLANRFYPVENVIAPVACLKLNGLILKSPAKEKGKYKIELLQDNTIVDSKEVTNNKPFEFNLLKNAWYTVRITKEGFLPLLISVDTKLKADNLKLYEFNFETELYHESKVNALDKNTLDLPIGLVRYDESYDKFYPADNYRAHIQGAF